MARRTHDPAERREAALKFLAERYYQASREFSHILTASFPPDSATAEKLLANRECLLDFEQFSQRYRLHCTVRRLSPNTPLHRAAPSLFPDCCINRRIRYYPDQTRSGLRESPSFPRFCGGRLRGSGNPETFD